MGHPQPVTQIHAMYNYCITYLKHMFVFLCSHRQFHIRKAIRATFIRRFAQLSCVENPIQQFQQMLEKVCFLH